MKLHGITKDNDGNLGMIMKYAAHGSLRDYLKSHASELTWYQKVQLSKQITIGLSFIHRERIFHRVCRKCPMLEVLLCYRIILIIMCCHCNSQLCSIIEFRTFTV